MRPSQTKNLYQRLGIERESSPEEIKTAYRKSALRWHPDQNKGNEEMSKLEFIAVSEAFEELYYNRKISERKTESESVDEEFERYWKLFNDIFDNVEMLKPMKQIVMPEMYTLLKMFGVDIFNYEKPKTDEEKKELED